MKEIKDDINRWRDIACSWVGRINIVKMTILPNSIYRFNLIPTKLPMTFFTELEQKISQFIWKHKRPWMPRLSWERRMELEESNFLTSNYTTKLQSSRQYGTGAKTEYRSMEQDRNPRNKPMHLWVPFFFAKGGKNIQWGKDSLFNKWCWENWTGTCKRMKSEHFLNHTQR